MFYVDFLPSTSLKESFNVNFLHILSALVKKIFWKRIHNILSIEFNGKVQIFAHFCAWEIKKKSEKLNWKLLTHGPVYTGISMEIHKRIVIP